MDNLDIPQVAEKRETRISKWLTMVERDIIFPGETEKETYHSVRPYDYVSILAITRDRRIPLVKQYRPILERETLELPGGLVDDDGMSPETTVLAELHQETGMKAPSAKAIGVLAPDPGRLDNKFYCFFADNVEVDPDAVIEKRIEVVWTNWNELRNMVSDGRFTSSPQIALLALAYFRGCIND